MTSEHEPAGGGDTDHDDAQSDPPRDAHDRTTLPLRRRREFWFWVTAFTVAVLVAAALAIPLPYYVEGPGSVRPTEALISVDGTDSFDEQGRIAFTTVSQSEATPALLFQAWLDESIDVLARKEVLGDRSDEEDREINQRLMAESKVVALVVAFRKVGLEAEFTGDGALIEEIVPAMPAEGVLEKGETIIAVDGQPVKVAADVGAVLKAKAVGDDVEVTARNAADDATRTVSLKLGSSPDEPGRPLIGVSISTAGLRADLPVDVELDSGSVIGPSAGLAWTLGVIDRLTPGRLDGGRSVVVTGTMSLDGTVGPIGGLAQKTAAAIDFGADLLLYPAQSDPKDVKRMKALADGHLRVEPVGTIDDALAVLAPDGLTPVASS